jgi:hypothetical protein
LFLYFLCTENAFLKKKRKRFRTLGNTHNECNNTTHTNNVVRSPRYWMKQILPLQFVGKVADLFSINFHWCLSCTDISLSVTWVLIICNEKTFSFLNVASEAFGYWTSSFLRTEACRSAPINIGQDFELIPKRALPYFLLYYFKYSLWACLSFVSTVSKLTSDSSDVQMHFVNVYIFLIFFFFFCKNKDFLCSFEKIYMCIWYR